MASRGRARVVQQTWELVNALWGQEGHIEARRPLPLHGQSTHFFSSHTRVFYWRLKRSLIIG
jgi:hypothetical protein